MCINFAHLSAQGISFAVFDADSRTHTRSDRATLLSDLTNRARSSGLRIDKSALAYVEHGRLSFFGTPDLVDYLANGWRVTWTHRLDI